jgi:hypothetical protein
VFQNLKRKGADISRQLLTVWKQIVDNGGQVRQSFELVQLLDDLPKVVDDPASVANCQYSTFQLA